MDKEQLFKPRLPEAEVDIPGVGTVRVRSLSRFEAMLVQETGSLDAKERRILRYGLVDPVLTEAEVKRWQEASPATEIEAVTDKITELSGMLETSEKAAVKEFESDPDLEFRVPVGDETQHDGRGASGDDEPR